MAAYDDWWASPDRLPPPDELWRPRGWQTPFAPNWGQLQDPGVFAAPRPQPAGDVVLPRGAPSPFGDAMPNMATGAPAPEDSTFRLATAALAPYATGNARLGGPSSVEGVGEDLSQKFLTMAQGMPEHLRQRLAIKSGYRDQARQMQVNPSAPNSLHGAGTGPPGTGRALDLVPDPEVLAWIRENGPQKYGVGFPLYPKDPREIDHLEAVSPGGARLSPGDALSPPSTQQGQQRMAGIGDIFGRAPAPGLLDSIGYMDPKEYDARRNSASMLGLYAGLLQGGGPSLQPRNFGSALGAGLIGQNQFGTQFDEAQQHRATAQAKLAEIDIKRKGFQLAQDWINQGEGGGIKTPADTAGTPAAKTPDFGAEYKGSGDPASLVKHFESGGNYNIGYGGTDLSKAPRDQYGFPIWEGKDNSHAAGAYQFQPGTWARYAGPLGIKDFSPESQDKVFAAAYAAEGWKPWMPYNPRLAAEVARRTTAGAGERTAAAGAPIPDFTEGRSQQLGTATPDQFRPVRPSIMAAQQNPAAPAPPAGPAPAPAVMTQQAQYAADVAAGRRPIFPPGTKFNSNGLAISPDLTATLPGQQSGANLPPGIRIPAMAPPAASGSTIRPIAATDAPEPPPADAGGNGPQFGSGVLRGPAPVPTGPAPVPQAIAPAPAVPPASPAAAPGGGVPVAMPPAPPRPGAAPAAAPEAGGPVSVTVPAAPALPMPTILAPQPLPAAPEMPGVPARPVIPPSGAAPAVSPQVAAQARRAQGVVIGLTMMGVHVPDFLQKEAGIAIAGRTAAAEAEAKQPIELQNKMFEASLTAAQKRWDALTDQQKETLAAQRGATKDQMQAMYNNIHEQYKSILQLSTAGPIAQATAEGQLPSELAKLTGKTTEELRRDWDKPDKVEWTDADGVPRMRIASPRQLYAELNGAPPPGAPPMAGTPAPAPGVVAPGAAVPGAAPPGAVVPGGMRTGLSPAEKAQQEGRAKQSLDYTNAVSTEAQQAIGGRADIDVALAQAPNLNWQGPGAAYKQQFNRITASVLNLNTEHVAAYETAQQMMGGMLRTALRASDPNPTERQQQMMMETFPTPKSSPQGYQQGLRHLQGIADWKVYRQEALNEWRQTHRSDEGFKESFKYSAIPFVVARMPESERTQYYAQLYRADPKAYDRLVSQMRETESKGYNYKY